MPDDRDKSLWEDIPSVWLGGRAAELRALADTYSEEATGHQAKANSASAKADRCRDAAATADRAIERLIGA